MDDSITVDLGHSVRSVVGAARCGALTDADVRRLQAALTEGGYVPADEEREQLRAAVAYYVEAVDNDVVDFDPYDDRFRAVLAGCPRRAEQPADAERLRVLVAEHRDAIRMGVLEETANQRLWREALGPRSKPMPEDRLDVLPDDVRAALLAALDTADPAEADRVRALVKEHRDAIAIDIPVEYANRRLRRLALGTEASDGV